MLKLQCNDKCLNISWSALKNGAKLTSNTWFGELNHTSSHRNIWYSIVNLKVLIPVKIQFKDFQKYCPGSQSLVLCKILLCDFHQNWFYVEFFAPLKKVASSPATIWKTHRASSVCELKWCSRQMQWIRSIHVGTINIQWHNLFPGHLLPRELFPPILRCKILTNDEVLALS